MMANRNGDRYLACMSYVMGSLSMGLACLGMIILAELRKSSFLRFHAKQSFRWNMFIGCLIVMVVILSFALNFLCWLKFIDSVPFFARPGRFSYWLIPAIFLNLFVNIWAGFMAFRGKIVSLPVVGMKPGPPLDQKEQTS